jgi:hypothetical protein
MMAQRKMKSTKSTSRVGLPPNEYIPGKLIMQLNPIKKFPTWTYREITGYYCKKLLLACIYHVSNNVESY